MPDDATVLAGDFPPAGREQWLALVDEARLDRLRTVTEDGITIEPLSTAADAPDPATVGWPGSPPFTRGRTPAIGRPDGWDVRQPVDLSRPGAAVEELERGATSVVVDLRGAGVIDAEALRPALDGVRFDLAAVVLDAGSRWREAAEALAELWQDAAVDRTALRGGLGADPLGELVSGAADDGVDDELAAAVDAARGAIHERPGVRTFTIDGTRFHDAGATDAEELGATVAVAVETVRALLDADVSMADACAQIELRLAATADQFATIAKLRAARRLWARVAEVAGNAVAAGATPLHAVTSRAMLAVADPFVNALRSTIACFAAAVGGADAITVSPHDAAFVVQPDEPSRRLARNTQTILASESHVAMVADPAGGSWFVERFTADLAEAAWRWFQEIEAHGGFRAAAGAGLVADRLTTSRARRERRVATRAVPLVGVSEFPDLDEGPLAADAPSPDRPVHRWSEPFERRRRRADSATRAGTPPVVFLATIGSVATFTARATWIRLLLGAGGVGTVAGPVSDDPSVIAGAFAESGAIVACVASSDAASAEHGAAVVDALRAAGARRVYLAGRGGGDGVDHHLRAGGDALADLDDVLDALGVP